MIFVKSATIFYLSLVLLACNPELPSNDSSSVFSNSKKGEDGKSDASAHATFLEFSFSASLVSDHGYWAERAIEQQLLFTVGQLNGHRSVGRLDQLQLSNVTSEFIGPAEGYRVTYDARLLVAWGKRSNIPERFTLKLPKNLSHEAKQQYTEKYKENCVDFGAHDVDVGTIWYYFRPDAYGCTLSDEDTITVEATVEPSTVLTTGLYPEYDKVWEDQTLRAVMIFGQANEDDFSRFDAGFTGYRNFYNRVVRRLRAMNTAVTSELTVTPEITEEGPNEAQRHIMIEAQLEDGKTVRVDLIFVKNVRTAGDDFNTLYRELTPRADLIIYNGHAGLGANIRALAHKGSWVEGQYAVIFMNGCDTYAYVDDALFNAHADVNPDDPIGTKYVDLVNNAMPAYFSEMSQASAALFNGLLAYDSPKTYEQIFMDVDASQVILVTGEHDNTFTPPEPPAHPTDHTLESLNLSMSLLSEEEFTFQTVPLEPGVYHFSMSGTGDADLYISANSVATMNEYHCRPFLIDSEELCKIELREGGVIFGLIRGWSPQSNISLSTAYEPLSPLAPHPTLPVMMMDAQP